LPDCSVQALGSGLAAIAASLHWFMQAGAPWQSAMQLAVSTPPVAHWSTAVLSGQT
jgi:hypothetical protein